MTELALNNSHSLTHSTV